MILKLFGLSFTIVAFLHFYILDMNFEKNKTTIIKNQNQKIEIIKLSN